MSKAKSTQVLRFPSNLAITEQDMEYVKITPMKFLKSKATVDGELGPIISYMPASFAVSNVQQWSNADFGLLNDDVNSMKVFGMTRNAKTAEDAVGAVTQLGADFMGIINNGFGKNLSPIASGAFAQATTALFQVYGGIMGVNPNVTSNAILSKTEGAIVNPQSELYYQAPSLRTWVMTYEFTPRSKADEDAMNAIIKRLKMASSPKRNEENPWLEIPRVFQVEFMRGGGVNQRMPKTKPAALVKLDVIANNGLDYWASFQSGGPVSYTIQMAFSEIQLVYSGEHEEGEVGY